MRPASLMTRPVTIRRTSPGEPNEYGDPQPVITSTATVGEIQQRQADEPDGQGDLSVTQWQLYLPADTQIDQGDTVTIDGTAYHVTGQPWQARNPRTRTPTHTQATLTRTAAPGDTS